MAGWDLLQSLVKEEVVQRTEEGCKTKGFEQKVEEAGDNERQLISLYQELSKLQVRSDFPYEEPSDLEHIRRLRPEGPRSLQTGWSEQEWRNKFKGAWLGRSVGCALGKPLECWPFMAGTKDNPGWRNIQRWFEGADAWPIKGYTPIESPGAKALGLELAHYGLKSTRERIAFMETDDDIRYTVLGLMMLEEKGLEWDSWDIGKLWHNKLTYSQVCTAETQAYLNFSQITSHVRADRPEDWKNKLEWVRMHLNPYREWIGAQIRVDGYAYGVAGRPELAAELAWRDASFSHIKNGIYGAMFVAAMISAAFVKKDPRRIVEIGLSEIPATSRLAEDINKAVEIAASTNDQLTLVARVWESFKHYNPVHTNNNAALVAASLIFGDGDFERSVTTSVLGGWDTDCNGATVGSIMGALLGAEAIPSYWTAPLNNTLYADLIGFDPITISSCADRSYQVFRKLSK